MQTGAAHLVQGGGGSLDGETGLQSGLTGGVLAQTGLQHVAEKDLIDVLGVHAAALEGLGDDDLAQLHGGDALQAAAKTAHGRAGHAYQINFFHLRVHSFYVFFE